MQENFPQCLALVLKEEGGNDDDPNDHGGRTSRGITQREWDSWRSSRPEFPEDVWEAPQDQIEALYHAQYWEPYCDRMPSGVDLVFFDFCVNAGRTQAVKTLQKALGVPADGMLGINTWSAIGQMDAVTLVHAYSSRRRTFYENLAQYPRYGKGWVGRANRIETAAVRMAGNEPVTQPVVVSLPSAKANPNDTVQPIVSTQTASTGALAGSIGGTVSDQLQQAQSALTPLQDAFVWAKYICIGLTILCAGLAIYSVIHQRQVQAAT